MTVSGFIGPWSDYAYRHIPAGASFDVLDFRFAGKASDNRWNFPGEPTLYLASDEGVAIAELARHIEQNRSPELRSQVRARQLYRLRLSIDRLVDLRNRAVVAGLPLENAPYCFLDLDIARATAHFIRRVTSAQAMLVPSMAFLDQPDRWVGVLFLEKLPADPRQYVLSVERDQLFSLGP